MKTPSPIQIKRARIAAGLTQREAAALIGYQNIAWCRWEKGNRDMRPALWELFRSKIKGRNAA